jgi:hypothetical protein
LDLPLTNQEAEKNNLRMGLAARDHLPEVI